MKHRIPDHITCILCCYYKKSFLCIMMFSHYLAHTEPIFNALHIFPFHKLFFYSTRTNMYKYSINCLPLSVCKLQVKNSIVHQHNTKNCDTLRVSKGTKTFIRISVRFDSEILRLCPSCCICPIYLSMMCT